MAAIILASIFIVKKRISKFTTKVIIIGAAGTDFHYFNTVFHGKQAIGTTSAN